MELPLLSFTQIITVLRCTMGFCVQFISYFVKSYNIPLIANHLTANNYSPVFMGSTMITASLCYIVAMIALGTMTNMISKKGILVIGLAFEIFGILISGMDQFRSFYSPGFFTITGITFVGLGMGFTLIPVMPEIIEGIEAHPKFAYTYDELTLQNNLAGYFICCQALGEALGPLASSLIE